MAFGNQRLLWIGNRGLRQRTCWKGRTREPALSSLKFSTVRLSTRFMFVMVSLGQPESEFNVCVELKQWVPSEYEGWLHNTLCRCLGVPNGDALLPYGVG